MNLASQELMQMTRLLFSTILTATLASQALATTGWDRHEVDIVGKYRIQGANGASFVHRIDTKGQVTGPALCGTLDATGKWNGLYSPPDYVVAGPRLFIRYPNLDAATANHFSIHIDDGSIVGPLTARECEQAFANPELKWRTPETAADQFHRAVWIAGLLALVVVAGLVLGLSLFVRRLISVYRARGKRDRKQKLNIDAPGRQIVK
jgi:hypothetical protein